MRLSNLNEPAVNRCNYINSFIACVATIIFGMTVAKATEQRNSIVFAHKDNGQSDFGYRIPALAVTHNGTLLAFCERRLGLADHAQNDIVLRRSSSGGDTWGDVQVIADEAGDSLNDPCVVVLKSRRILLRYKRYPQGVHQRASNHTVRADAGYDGPRNVRIYLTHSDDHGRTWSKPRDVTRQMRRPEAMAVGSPGVAIQLTRGAHEGRIVFPNYESFPVGDDQRRFDNAVSYSDDGAMTWKRSEPMGMGDLPGQGNEAQIVELTDGSLLLSSRIFGDKAPYRRMTVSKDGGLTWTRHRHVREMQTPACMSSVIRYTWAVDGKAGILLHSVPNTADGRANGTIFGSEDDGETWRKLRVIEPGGFAYSCLARLPNGDIGCLFEADGYRAIVFMRMTQAWLFGASNQ